MSDHSARTVYVYEIEPTQIDGRGTSGWKVTIVTDTMDMADVLRTMRVAVHDRFINEGQSPDDGHPWVGIKTATLLSVASLDPRIAA